MPNKKHEKISGHSVLAIANGFPLDRAKNAGSKAAIINQP